MVYGDYIGITFPSSLILYKPHVWVCMLGGLSGPWLVLGFGFGQRADSRCRKIQLGFFAV